MKVRRRWPAALCRTVRWTGIAAASLLLGCVQSRDESRWTKPPSLVMTHDAAGAHSSMGHSMPDPSAARVPNAGPVAPTVVAKVTAPGPAPPGMVWISPGRFSMGSDYAPFADARPIHTVEVSGFWTIAPTETNGRPWLRASSSSGS